MIYTIKSRKLKREIVFYKEDKETESYIFVNLNGKEGYLGKQICKGGYITGIAIKASNENFKKVCNKWLRELYKNCDRLHFRF